MKKLLLLLAAGYTLSTAAQPNLTARFDSLTAAYEKNGYHGVILVANGNQILYEKGYGLADFDRQRPHTPQTVFKTESVGKMFTATSILQLVEQKKLRLDQTVNELVPALQIRNADKITVDHLLKHTSGLQSPWDHPEWKFKRLYTKPELMKVVEEVPLAFDTPGQRMFYSNSGYCVLGWILEALTGKAFDDYFQENIFNKLGMTNTRHLGDTLMPANNGAQPYRMLSSKRYIPMTTTLGTKAGAAGGWISTAGDLYRFMLGLNTGRLLKPETWALMQTANGTQPRDSAYRFYAYGLEAYVNQLIPGTRLYGHNGGGAGFSIDAFVDPETGYIVTSCTNLYQNSRPIVANYFRAALGKPVQPVSRPLAVRLQDLIDSVGIESFVQNEKAYFKQLNAQVHPGVFAQLYDALELAADHQRCAKWMELARTYFPEEGYLWMLSGDNQLKNGNKEEARRFYEKAWELGQRQKDNFVTSQVEVKLKKLA